MPAILFYISYIFYPGVSILRCSKRLISTLDFDPVSQVQGGGFDPCRCVGPAAIGDNVASSHFLKINVAVTFGCNYKQIHHTVFVNIRIYINGTVRQRIVATHTWSSWCVASVSVKCSSVSHPWV